MKTQPAKKSSTCSDAMAKVPPNTSVDRPCDIHLIECLARDFKKMPDAAKCKNWDAVPRKDMKGVEMMDCPPWCLAEANRDRERCNLEYWQLHTYGESLWPIPPYGEGI